MGKKIPSVFANRIDKELHNNDRVYYSSSIGSEVIETKKIESQSSDKMQKNVNLNINQKINNIFNSSRYVYKADVVITTKEGTVVKKIIGQNKTHLITIENELISISDIVDIDFSN